MHKQCVNCPGAVDHSTAECPIAGREQQALVAPATPELPRYNAPRGTTLSETDKGELVMAAEHDAAICALRTQVEELWAENEALRTGLLDPESVLINMLRGTIAKLSPRGICKVYGQVLNGEDAQHVEISRLRAELEAARGLPAAPAVVNQQVTTAATCNHDWTDDGQHLLVCTSCGAQEDHDPRWRDMATAPRDGTMVRLLVEFTEHATEDADQAPTIGANNFDNDGEDRWQFAGWCWSHDHFTQGQGEPIGWLPMLDEPHRITPQQQGQQP